MPGDLSAKRCPDRISTTSLFGPDTSFRSGAPASLFFTSVNSSARQLLAKLPQPPRCNAVGCPRPYATHFLAVVTREGGGDVAILAINAAHAVELRARGTPYARGGPLLRRLLIVLGIDNRLPGFVDDLTGVNLGLRHVADQVRHDPAGMYGEGADTSTL